MVIALALELFEDAVEPASVTRLWRPPVARPCLRVGQLLLDLGEDGFEPSPLGRREVLRDLAATRDDEETNVEAVPPQFGSHLTMLAQNAIKG